MGIIKKLRTQGGRTLHLSCELFMLMRGDRWSHWMVWFCCSSMSCFDWLKTHGKWKFVAFQINNFQVPNNRFSFLSHLQSADGCFMWPSDCLLGRPRPSYGQDNPWCIASYPWQVKAKAKASPSGPPATRRGVARDASGLGWAVVDVPSGVIKHGWLEKPQSLEVS